MGKKKDATEKKTASNELGRNTIRDPDYERLVAGKKPSNKDGSIVFYPIRNKTFGEVYIAELTAEQHRLAGDYWYQARNVAAGYEHSVYATGPTVAKAVKLLEKKVMMQIDANLGLNGEE